MSRSRARCRNAEYPELARRCTVIRGSALSPITKLLFNKQNQSKNRSFLLQCLEWQQCRHCTEAEKEDDHSEALQQPSEATGLHTCAQGRKVCHGATGPAPVCSRHIRAQMQMHIWPSSMTQIWSPGAHSRGVEALLCCSGSVPPGAGWWRAEAAVQSLSHRHTSPDSCLCENLSVCSCTSACWSPRVTPFWGTQISYYLKTRKESRLTKGKKTRVNGRDNNEGPYELAPGTAGESQAQGCAPRGAATCCAEIPVCGRVCYLECWTWTIPLSPPFFLEIKYSPSFMCTWRKSPGSNGTRICASHFFYLKIALSYRNTVMRPKYSKNLKVQLVLTQTKLPAALPTSSNCWDRDKNIQPLDNHRKSDGYECSKH